MYRGLRKEEIDAGCILIPRNQKSFSSLVRFPVKFPVNFDPNHPGNAIRDHIDGNYLSGVSTSMNFEVAKRYAKDKIVVKIFIERLDQCNIKAWVAADWCKYVNNPEDQEVILVNAELKHFPKEIIEEVLIIE